MLENLDASLLGLEGNVMWWAHFHAQLVISSYKAFGTNL